MRYFDSFAKIFVLALFLTACFDSTVAGGASEKNVSVGENDVLETDDSAPFTIAQFSFFAPLQIFSDSYDVRGVRLALPYGSNRSLMGIDLGIVHKLDNLYGLGLSIFYSQRSGEMRGVSLSGAFNLSKGNDTGLSAAGFYNDVESVDGVQAACLYNKAKSVNGIQIGLCNSTEKLNGVQIGLCNYCKDEPFKYTLFFNFWDSATVEKKRKESK